ncbi:conserved membrane hypothetical protein [Candidatus Competibacter denitrificans Run_A_D11]|uniref:Transport protein n=1 Tax=Candidatus Competibacter denitrificans Run_A_D11 TaxID=1400863 RepID=W6MCF1_9GAMM|nr:DUF554 domain-containing protein [Candidatus Competibacter denitrificans]CDI01943.1 conserved membrane hypothetical protein [Candidatus Competibacter denitrificans Run_A_D11]HAS86822.1 DUF554 domain-containing protein [Candidatus Competibacteraceae bacterium]HRC68165.1 DUF554 domain-containing protein [Candidatus Competibacter denitrificans]
MIGTLVNTGTVLVGSAVGLMAGSRLPENIKTILVQALGLSVVAIGLRMALEAQHALLAIGCLLLGGVSGELLRIEQRLEGLAEILQSKLRSRSSRFVEGFVTATLLYLTGAMTIVGSIQDGTIGDPSVLLIKALLDGVASVALASSLGIGVMYSALPVLVVQGGITLLASQMAFLSEPAVLDAVNATGGLLILGIGINLLEIRRIHVGNLLPALLYAIVGALLI